MSKLLTSTSAINSSRKYNGRACYFGAICASLESIISNQEINILEEPKRFDEWNYLKKNLHKITSVPKISEGEIYWCGFGENVGVEINGKNARFSRPVLIMKKLSRYGFLGIPLTSQPHDGSWYIHFNFHNREQVAVLSQQRVFSTSRLYERMGRIDEADMKKIKEGFHRLFCE